MERNTRTSTKAQRRDKCFQATDGSGWHPVSEEDMLHGMRNDYDDPLELFALFEDGYVLRTPTHAYRYA